MALWIDFILVALEYSDGVIKPSLLLYSKSLTYAPFSTTLKTSTTQTSSSLGYSLA